MALTSFGFIIILAFILQQGSYINMINARSVGSSAPAPAPAREAENTMILAQRPRPKYTCTSILGVCGKTVTERRCSQLCYSYYSGANPAPYCGNFDYQEPFCYCDHDCLKKN